MQGVMHFHSLGIQNLRSNLSDGVFKVCPMTARVKKAATTKYRDYLGCSGKLIKFPFKLISSALRHNLQLLLQHSVVANSSVLAFSNLGTVLPHLGSGCARFGALQDWADFTTSLHSHLEKANLFQKNAVGNNRQYHSQISSAQQNNFFFFLSASIYSLHYHFSQSSLTWRAVC